MNKLLLFLLILSFQVNTIHSQTLIGSYQYNFDSNMDGWTSQSITNAGYWSWTSNGKADSGNYWNNRERIQSESSGGAIVFDGDFMINNNIGNTSNPYVSSVQSPVLDFTGESTVYLKFYQYYRSFDTNTSVEISIDGGNNWTSIGINNNLKTNVETSIRDYKILDLSPYVADKSSVLVRFVIENNYYFWILDDISFCNSKPIEETYPRDLGDALALLNYPYQIDDSQWAYKEKEIVVQFNDGVPEINKQALRDAIGAVKLDSCVCDKLELWSLEDHLVVGGSTISKYGKSIGILERVKTSRASTDIDEVDVNRYNSNELLISNSLTVDDGATVENYIEVLNPPDETTIKIAILDTGIDILHSSLSAKINQSLDHPSNEDDDFNCYKNDIVGWNFVDKNNNPTDDHGHGTHVAGIIEQYLESNMPGNSDFRLIPYKTHDAHGVSNLFDVTCASYLAIKDKVSVINCSWGFYGAKSDILYEAFDAAAGQDIMIIAASGNDNIDLAIRPQYPACYSLDNIISVGSYSPMIDGLISTIQNSDFSNFDANVVDILANGENVNSTLPNNSNGYKTGTSMSTPLIAAAIALEYFQEESHYSNIKNRLFEKAFQVSGEIQLKVLNGNVFDPFVLEAMPLAIENDLDQVLNEINVFPSVVTDHLNVVFPSDLQDVLVEIIDVNSQLIAKTQIKNVYKNEIIQIELENCISGVYFVRIKINDYIRTSKIIKM